MIAFETQSNVMQFDQLSTGNMRAHAIGTLAVAVMLLARSAHCQSLEWIRQFGGPATDLGQSVTVDVFGDVYVAGNYGVDVNDALQSDFLLLKYKSSGELLWSKQYDFTKTDRHWSGLSTDMLGNVYFGGSVVGPTSDRDAILIKVDPDGNQLWDRRLDGGGAGSDEAFRNIRTDFNGDILVSGVTVGGSVDGSGNSGTDAIVGKYGADGRLKWMRQLHGNQGEEAWGLATDAQGNVLVSGDNDTQDAFVTKLSATGAPLWNRLISSSQSDASRGVATDAIGNVYVAGTTYGSLAGDNLGQADAFVRKFSASGDVQWTQQFGSAQYEFVTSIDVDASGNSFTVGTGLLLTMLNAGGQVAWSAMPDLFGRGVAIDDENALYVTGNSENALEPDPSGTDVFLARVFRMVLGDTNADGVVDLADLNNVRNHFGQDGGLGDTNGDNLIDLTDLNNVRNNFGAGVANAVPEPQTWALALAGGIAFLAVQRSRRAKK